MTRATVTAAAAALALAAGAAPAATAHGGAAPAPARGARARPVTISGPGQRWYWNLVDRRVAARAAPSVHAARIATLGRTTPEGTANLVLALAREQVGGRLWVRVRLGVLPNGTTGWVPRGALGGYNEMRTHLLVSTRTLRARLERAGRTVFRARVGVGRRRSPTPTGEFFVRDRLTTLRRSLYGPLAFGTSARSAVLTDWPVGGFIGVHGTDQPGLIPGHVSHGCIRMRNADILRLGRLMPVGTPVTISG